VKYVGFSPLEPIQCATKPGAEILGWGHEMGTLEAGKLADLRVLQEWARFLAVMQGGILKAGQPAHAPMPRYAA
jgi:imidazolonepropionase-like amidohydrolase